MKKLIWLRHETKPFEQRCALAPKHVSALLEQGFNVVVERSNSRIFDDSEYEKLGVKMAESSAWKSEAPKDAIILGLKELEDEQTALIHQHIYFAHSYKGQSGSEKVLNRFHEGGGSLYDLEYLVDQNERRIAAFGYWAGFAGAAVGLELWLHQDQGKNFNEAAPLKAAPSSKELIERLKIALNGKPINPLIIGAHGRCGKGAQDFFKALGVGPTLWGSKETKEKSSQMSSTIPEIMDFDLMVNAAFLDPKQKTHPWLTFDSLLLESRKLKVISDVSCDPTNPSNPLPLYFEATTIKEPALKIQSANSPLWLTAIDHLPSLLPRESSEDYGDQLFSHLLKFLKGNESDNDPFNKSLKLFHSHLTKFSNESSTLST